MLDTIENVLSLYKYLSCLRRNYKMFGLILVVIFVPVYIATIFIITYTCDYSNEFVQCIIANSIHVSSASVIIVTLTCGVKLAESFDIYSAAMRNVEQYCSYKALYKTSIKYLSVSVFIILLIHVLIYIIAIVVVLLSACERLLLDFTFTFWEICKGIVLIVGDARFTIEFFMFILHLRKVTIFWTVLKENLMIVSKKLDTIKCRTDNTVLLELQRDLMEVAAVYKTIIKCCDELEKLYGTQVFMI